MTPPWQILQGDARAVLRSLPEKSVQACVTSPPFWPLRSYSGTNALWSGNTSCNHDFTLPTIVSDKRGLQGSFRAKTHRLDEASRGATCARCGCWRGPYGLEPTLSMYLDHTIEIFREVKRVLRDDGILWINIGDCYASSGGYANGGKDGGFLAERKGRGAGTNSEGLKPKDLILLPARVALALQNDGWYLRNEIQWIKRNGLPASITDRLTLTHEYIFLFTKNESYYYDIHGAKKPCTQRPQRRSAPHKPRNSGEGAGQPPNTYSTSAARDVPATDGSTDRQLRTSDLWRDGVQVIINDLLALLAGEGSILASEDGIEAVHTATSGFKGSHFASFPRALVSPLIRVSTPDHGVCSSCGAPYRRVVQRTSMVVRPSARREAAEAAGAGGGRTLLAGTMLEPPTTTVGWEKTCACPSLRAVPATVLDPFVGSGTTGIEAISLGREFIGVDLSEEFCRMSVERIEKESKRSIVEPMVRAMAEFRGKA